MNVPFPLASCRRPTLRRLLLVFGILLAAVPGVQAQVHVYYGKARFKPDWATFDAFRASYNDRYGALGGTPLAPFGNHDGYATGFFLDLPGLMGVGRRPLAPIVGFGVGYEWHGGETRGIFETEGGAIERRLALRNRIMTFDLGFGLRIPVLAVTGTFGYYIDDFALRSSLVYPSGVESLGSDSPLNGKFGGKASGVYYGIKGAVLIPKTPLMLTIRVDKRFVHFLSNERDREIRLLTSPHDDSRSFHWQEYTTGRFPEFTGRENEYRYAPDTLPRDWGRYVAAPEFNAGPASKQGNVATDLGGFHVSVALALRLTP